MRTTICKSLLYFACLLATTTASAAEDEYVAFTAMAAAFHEVKVGGPVITSARRSVSESVYSMTGSGERVMAGDRITRLAYRGYNPGEAQTRHVSVWMQNTEEYDMTYRLGFYPTDQMTKVFEGDCTIPQGGTADERIPLLEITLDQPFAYGGSCLRITVVSTGEATEDIYFEQDYSIRHGRTGTASEATGDVANSQKGPGAVVELKAESMVRYVQGTVSDQYGQPVAGATVRLNEAYGLLQYEGTTDSNGQYNVRVERGSCYYVPTVTAPGHTSYTGYDMLPEQWKTGDYTLYNALDLKAGERYTLVLPEAPQAADGRYFRLDRVEETEVVFERELRPQANVPYVFYPYHDMHIDLREMDFSQTAGRVHLDGVDFIGSYTFIPDGPRLECDQDVIFDTDWHPANQYGFVDATHATLVWNMHAFEFATPTFVFHDPEDHCHALVEAGKQWTYDNYMPLRPDEYNHYYWYTLEGDTVVAGQACQAMYVENRLLSGKKEYVGALYEVDKKVYCFHPDKTEAQLLYDFGCNIGDTLHTAVGTLLVKDIAALQNQERELCQFELIPLDISPEDPESYPVHWIQGVGCTKDFFAMIPMAGNYNSLAGCEVNGDTLYQYVQPKQTEAGYHEMAIEGKTWNYVHYYMGSEGLCEEPYRYVVRGDTLIGRTNYKKLYRQDKRGERLACVLGEQGREVLKLYPGEQAWHQFFDFGRTDVGRMFDWASTNEPYRIYWTIQSVDTANYYGTEYRRYNCLRTFIEDGKPGQLESIEEGGNTIRETWVEGIGSLQSGIEPLWRGVTPQWDDDAFTFVSCYENGVCIYDANETYRPFVEEGKEWTVGVSYERNNIADELYHYRLGGDTIVGGQACKRMMYRTETQGNHKRAFQYLGAFYEKGKRVYYAPDKKKTFSLYYDFAANVGDTLRVYSEPLHYGWFESEFSCAVVGKALEKSKVYEGTCMAVVEEKIHSAGTYIQNRTDTWMEGVGAQAGVMHNLTQQMDYDYPTRLMTCRVGDEVIYYDPDIVDSVTEATPITKVQAPASVATGQWYDLTGRPVARPGKGVYIRDGKKVLLK